MQVGRWAVGRLQVGRLTGCGWGIAREGGMRFRSLEEAELNSPDRKVGVDNAT